MLLVNGICLPDGTVAVLADPARANQGLIPYLCGVMTTALHAEIHQGMGGTRASPGTAYETLGERRLGT